MVTNRGPELVLQQLEVRDRRKRSIHPELLDRFAQQDQRLFDLLIRHRAGEAVAEAIVAELLPAVHAKARRMSPVRLYGRDDLRQQLILELFRTARTIPLKRPAFLTRRLMLDASKRLTRRLEREWYHQLDKWYQQLDRREPIQPDEEGGEDER
jgi:hypothetical protein